MGYKLNIINRIKDSAYTFMEVQSKTGISRTRIETMHRKTMPNSVTSMPLPVSWNAISKIYIWRTNALIVRKVPKP